MLTIADHAARTQTRLLSKLAEARIGATNLERTHGVGFYDAMSTINSSAVTRRKAWSPRRAASRLAGRVEDLDPHRGALVAGAERDRSNAAISRASSASAARSGARSPLWPQRSWT